MPLREKIAEFKYSDALSDVGIKNRDHLWERLKTTARAQTDLERAQMIHDVSWVLTQLDDKEQDYLEKVCERTRRVVSDAYGPYIWEMLAEDKITLESFVAPVARLASRDSHDAFGSLLGLKGLDIQHATPDFAATFARWWLHNQVARRVRTRQIHNHERGTRVLVGRAKTCPDCQGKGLLESRIHEGIDRLREMPGRAGGRTFADFVRALGPDGSVSGDILIDFFGEEIICPNCRLWLDVPKQARNDWVCPVVDSNNSRIFWFRIEIVQ